MGSQLSLAAGGNFAFAIILATLTNFMCIVQIPQTLSLFMQGAGGVAIDPVAMQKTLVSNILLPLFLGKAVFSLPPIAALLKNFPLFFKLSTFTALAMLPMLEISQNVKAITGMGIDTLVKTGVVAVGFHSALLAFNFLITGLMGTSLEIRKTLIILGSQKQLTVSMAVLAILPDSLGNKGLMAIPCIMGWLTQNMMDTFAANKMSTWTVEDDNMTAAEDSAVAGRKKSAAAAAALAEKRQETKRAIQAKNRAAASRVAFEKALVQFKEAYTTRKDKRKAIAAFTSAATEAVRAEVSLSRARWATDEASARVTGEMARAQEEATNTTKQESLDEQGDFESLSAQAKLGPFPYLLGILPSLLTGLLAGTGLTLTGLHVLRRRNKLAWLPSTLTAGHDALLTA
jgi:sodium/bile acid cotransporter 7